MQSGPRPADLGKRFPDNFASVLTALGIGIDTTKNGPGRPDEGWLGSLDDRFRNHLPTPVNQRSHLRVMHGGEGNHRVRKLCRLRDLPCCSQCHPEQRWTPLSFFLGFRDE